MHSSDARADRELTVLREEISECSLCPRLVEYRERVARERRRAYRDQEYWGRAVPPFGDFQARLLILGLAPGAHGANRTGRVFTGDRSGDLLFRVLHRAGFANQPVSKGPGDGLELRGAYISCAVRCAPPDNKPDPSELRACRPYLERELRLLPCLRVVVVLGKIAFDSYFSACVKSAPGCAGLRRADTLFGHNRLYGWGIPVIASYHPSQQNTSTGRLTESMFLEVFTRAAELCRD